MIEINNLVRENIKKLKPYSSARGSFTSGVLLDANENPFGSVVNTKMALNRYPDPNQKELRAKLSRLINIPEKNLVFGVGSDEIIDQVIRIFAEPGKDKAIICEPTYGMYSVACNINNVEIVESLLTDDFQVNVDDVISKCEDRVKLVFLCSPNNPTANTLNKNDLTRLCKSVNAMVVVDEAYIDFAENESVINEVANYPNLIISRTFSKAWGMAAVRAGYAVANENVIDYFFKIKAPYNISKPTEKLILEALVNTDKRNEFIQNLNAEKKFLIDELSTIPQVEKIYKSDANFLIFKIQNASDVYKTLTEKGVIIRDRSKLPLLENCLRLSVGTREENLLFLNKLKEIYE